MVNFQTYAGTASPYNFNGLVRHYYLRRGPNHGGYSGESAVRNERRDLQSHEIAKQVRARTQTHRAIRYGARIKVAEVPPGPPVLETLVAEVYGPDYERRRSHWRAQISRSFEQTHRRGRCRLVRRRRSAEIRPAVDEEKAALNGISEDDIARAVQVALSGLSGGLAASDPEKEDVPLTVRLDRADALRAWTDLQSLKLPGRNRRQVSLARSWSDVAEADRGQEHLPQESACR